jgi:hypothetical protein
MDDLKILREAWEQPAPAAAPARAAARARLLEFASAAGSGREAAHRQRIQMPPSAPDVAGAARASLELDSSGRAGALQGGRRSRRLGPFIVAAVAAGAAVALAAVTLIPAGATRSGGPGTGGHFTGQPARGFPTGPTRSGGPGTGGHFTGQAARGFLLAMAARVSRADAAIGRYFCTRQVMAQRDLVGPGDKLLPSPGENGKADPSTPAGYRYALAVRYLNAWCVSRDGTRNEGGFNQALGAKPFSPADAAAWRRDGSPTRWRGWWAAGQDVTTQAGPRTVAPANAKGPRRHPWGTDSSLPADPAKLRAVLESAVPRHFTGRVRVEQLVFWMQLLMREPVRPAVRAAAYRVFAGIPGMQMKPGVKDPDGRTGAALWLGGSKDGDLGIFIVDPATGYLLAEAGVATRNIGGLPAGAFLGYTVYTYRWTNTLPG